MHPRRARFPPHHDTGGQENHDRGQILENGPDTGRRKLNRPEIGVLAHGNSGQPVDEQHARGPGTLPDAEKLVPIFEEAVYEEAVEALEKIGFEKVI